MLPLTATSSDQGEKGLEGTLSGHYREVTEGRDDFHSVDKGLAERALMVSQGKEGLYSEQTHAAR